PRKHHRRILGSRSWKESAVVNPRGVGASAAGNQCRIKRCVCRWLHIRALDPCPRIIRELRDHLTYVSRCCGRRILRHEQFSQIPPKRHVVALRQRDSIIDRRESLQHGFGEHMHLARTRHWPERDISHWTRRLVIKHARPRSVQGLESDALVLLQVHWLHRIVECSHPYECAIDTQRSLII